jgi:hypothetical protein
VAVFGLGGRAVVAAGAPGAAAVLGVLAAISTALLARFDQWEA